MSPKTFGEWLKEMRRKNNWTQMDLAKISNIPQTTISGWETGKVTNFRIDERIARLAKAFSLRLCELPFDLIHLQDKRQPEIQHHIENEIQNSL